MPHEIDRSPQAEQETEREQESDGQQNNGKQQEGRVIVLGNHSGTRSDFWECKVKPAGGEREKQVDSANLRPSQRWLWRIVAVMSPAYSHHPDLDPASLVESFDFVFHDADVTP